VAPALFYLKTGIMATLVGCDGKCRSVLGDPVLGVRV